MESFQELFDIEIVKNISSFVEDKMKVLKSVEDFTQKDEQLSKKMEDLEKDLPEHLKEKFDDVIRLTYQLEEYYFTLAYFLGSKHGEQISNL